MRIGEWIIIETKELQENLTVKREALQIPWWEKYTLSVQEAAKYVGFSDKKIRQIIDANETASFVLWNGTRPRIKRKLFEKFIDEKLTAI